MARELGDKLGPRIAHIAREHTLAIRRQLAPIEARIHAAATQQVIDRAGLEIADLHRDLYRRLLDDSAGMDPMARAFIERAIDGTHQWESIAGQVTLGGVSGGLSTILTNELAPAVQRIVAANPNIHADQVTAGAWAATGIATMDDAATLAAQAGYDLANFQGYYQLAQRPPGPPEIIDLFNRGLMARKDAVYWLHRNAIPPELIDLVLGLAVQLLPPADAALAVLRGNMSAADGYASAAKNGVTKADFDILIGNTGEPPALEEMLMLWRRGDMDTPTLERGIRQSRVRDEWIPYVLKLSVEPPSGADVIDARVQGLVSDAEARKRFKESGGDPTWYDTAYSSAANSPAPVELAEMANRGIIPWTGTGPNVVSWEQGFLEGHWKDKWMGAYRQVAQYHPPPREIATLVREGGLTHDEAMQLWKEAGLSPQIAELYWKAAHYTKTAAAHALAKSEVLRLYSDRAIGKDQALTMLESLGYNKTDATWEIDLADLTVARKLLESAISKIRSLYIAYKISKTEAAKALAELDVAASQAEQDLKIWDLERADNVKGLTASQITDAWYYELVGPGEARTMLEQIGYTPYDAWLLLNIKAKGKIPNFPKPAGA